MEIKIVENKISLDEIKKLAKDSFGDMVKAAVDTEKMIMAVGGELHADAEAVLLNHGSKQENIWGINIYPGKPEKERIEFISLINIRPSQNNRTMEIESAAIRSRISDIVSNLIK